MYACGASGAVTHQEGYPLVGGLQLATPKSPQEHKRTQKNPKEARKTPNSPRAYFLWIFND